MESTGGEGGEDVEEDEEGSAEEGGDEMEGEEEESISGVSEVELILSVQYGE